MGEIIIILNFKGGVGKTTCAVNTGIGLVNKGKRVLLVDTDPQGSLTVSLFSEDKNKFKHNLYTNMAKTIKGDLCNVWLNHEGIISHREGVDVMPSHIDLSGLENTLGEIDDGKTVLKRLLDQFKDFYDYIIVDCMPSLGMLTLNSLVAGDSVIIPLQPSYLAIKGLEQLIRTVQNVKVRLNPELRIKGLLFVMVDDRTISCREIKAKVYEGYGSNMIFKAEIPYSVRAQEAPVLHQSIFAWNPSGKVAAAYNCLAEEVISYEKY